jgi:hypothetical protein
MAGATWVQAAHMPALGYPHAGQTAVRGLSLSEMVPIVMLPPLVGCRCIVS